MKQKRIGDSHSTAVYSGCVIIVPWEGDTRNREAVPCLLLVSPCF